MPPGLRGEPLHMGARSFGSQPDRTASRLPVPADGGRRDPPPQQPARSDPTWPGQTRPDLSRQNQNSEPCIKLFLLYVNYFCWIGVKCLQPGSAAMQPPLPLQEPLKTKNQKDQRRSGGRRPVPGSSPPPSDALL
ncbi:PREDICTED: uncharacterized protein LOC107092440 isoform X3 [Cyprinodon variegatus]|uniref:uncharacterized protein LOC107092440 isoform X3 n=1 Tax=Cyprinodon variegatus TaxID=28743 RepID=UPI000742A7D1|nr:PREDICTED: uncharacterized protein LOC107092440 isoform X3 [Cyprinodon variegatus]